MNNEIHFCSKFKIKTECEIQLTIKHKSILRLIRFLLFLLFLFF